MNLASLVASVLMGFMGLFGFLFHQAPPPSSIEASSSAAEQGHNRLPQGVNPGGPMVPADSGTSLAPQLQSSTQTNTQVSASASASLPNGSVWETTLPLGDYKYSTSRPKQGYVYVCNVAHGGGGAQGNPTWISGNVWYPSEKVAVEGSVSWPDASYSMTLQGFKRIITSNGEPTDHGTGIFPIQSSDPAYQFDRNPNSIKPQNWNFTLPADPTMLAAPDCVYGEVGIMNDGALLFDGFDAEYRDAVAHETQDQWEGHPDESGVYHNHGFEAGPVKDSISTVVGFAFDGYPITGSLLPDGKYLHTADLDECHGITSTITLDGKSVTTYHYVLTQDFPYSVGCFRGKSYEPKPPSASGTQAQSGPQSQESANGSPSSPPQAAIAACTSKTSGSTCSFSGGQGTVSGTCQTPPGQSALACVPNN